MKSVKVQKSLGIKKLEKLLKKGVSIPVAVVIGFSAMAVTSQVSATSINMGDNIVVANNNTILSSSEEDTTVIDIANPINGISFNQYEVFDVESGDGVIFNNSMTDGSSQIGGYVYKNKNLDDVAKVIVNEVNGPKSNLAGDMEIFGSKADFIFANENGININGANVINASNVTFTNGQITNNGDSISIATSDNGSKIQIGSDGLNTDSKYLNLIGSKISIDGTINSKDNDKTNINIIAGNSKVDYDGKKLSLKDIENNSREIEALSAGLAGSMYGNNFYIISTNERAEDILNGDIHAKGKVQIASAGSVATRNISGNNINITADKEIINTGKLAAKNNIDLNAQNVINKSLYTGDVSVVQSGLGSEEGITEYNNRERKDLGYFDFVIKTKNNINFNKDIQSLKASITAGKNININRGVESGSFVNEGGDISAGANLNIKGNMSSNNIEKTIKVVDALENIESSIHFDEHSLVDGRFFVNKLSPVKQNLLANLEYISGLSDNFSDKGFYTALKKIKDPTVVALLNGLLGADWLTRDKIKDKTDWNYNAVVTFGTDEAVNISAGKTMQITGQNVELGSIPDTQIDENGDIKIVAEHHIVGDRALESIRGDVDIDVKKANVSAKDLVINADNLRVVNTDLNANSGLLIKTKNNINTKGSTLTADVASISTDGDLNMTSKLGYNGKGHLVVTGESGIKTQNGTVINARDIKAKGTEISSSEGTLEIDARDVKVENVYTIKSNYETDRKDPYWLGINEYKNNKTLTASLSTIKSKLDGKNIDIKTRKDLNVKGSELLVKDKDSIIKIKAGGNVNITNSQDGEYRNNYSDERGSWSGKYHLLSLKNNTSTRINVNPSIVESTQGNVDVAAKNINVVASNITAGKDITLKAKENVNLLSAMNQENDESYTLDWDIASLHVNKEKTAKNIVKSAVLTAGETVFLDAGADINTESVKIEGADVTLNATGDINNTAKQNEITTESTTLDAGFSAGGKISFAGMGASGEVNSATSTTKAEVKGPEGFFELKNDYKNFGVSGKVGAELHYKDTTSEEKTTVNNEIVATSGSVNMTAGNTAEIGNTNITAAEDVNITADKIATHNLDNSKTESSNSLDLAIEYNVSATNPTLEKLSTSSTKIAKVKDRYDQADYVGTAEAIKDALNTGKDLVKTLPEEINKDDIARIRDGGKASVVYTHTYDNVTATNKNSIQAGNKVSLTAENGNIELNNSNVNAKEVEMIADSGSVILGAGKTTEVHTKDSVNLSVQAGKSYAINPIDGIKGTVDVSVNAKYNGSAQVSTETTPTKIETEKLEIVAESTEIATPTKTEFKDERNIGVTVKGEGGISSNHAIQLNGNVNGEAGYKAEVKHTFVDKNGNNQTVAASTGIGMSGTMGIDGTNPTGRVASKDTTVKVNDTPVVAIKGRELNTGIGTFIKDSMANGIVEGTKNFVNKTVDTLKEKVVNIFSPKVETEATNEDVVTEETVNAETPVEENVVVAADEVTTENSVEDAVNVEVPVEESAEVNTVEEVEPEIHVEEANAPAEKVSELPKVEVRAIAPTKEEVELKEAEEKAAKAAKENHKNVVDAEKVVSPALDINAILKASPIANLSNNLVIEDNLALNSSTQFKNPVVDNTDAELELNKKVKASKK